MRRGALPWLARMTGPPSRPQSPTWRHGGSPDITHGCATTARPELLEVKETCPVGETVPRAQALLLSRRLRADATDSTSRTDSEYPHADQLSHSHRKWTHESGQVDRQTAVSRVLPHAKRITVMAFDRVTVGSFAVSAPTEGEGEPEHGEAEAEVEARR